MVTPAGPHVLRLITRLNIGGPARQALLLTRELAATYPTMLAAGTPSEVEGELSDPKVHVERVDLTREVDFRQDQRAARQVRALLRRTRPQILHTHMAKAGFLGRAAALTIRPRPELVHTFHGHVLDGYFNPALQRTFIEIERRLAKRTDVLIAISPEVRDSLLELKIGRPDQYRVIPLGFDLSELLSAQGPSGALRRSVGIGADVCLVGIVGRLAPIKDHSTMLRAIASTPSVHLAVVGDGEERGAIEREVRDLGLTERVHFTGWRSEIAEVMGDLDIVALTSRNEGTPVSLIEASAAARPVVATDVGGVRFVVQDGETGFVCPAGDPASISKRLAELAEAPELRARMGEAGRRFVRDRFGSGRLVRDIAALYAELSGPRQSPGE
ncbi:MAG: hypothetical protein QOH26_1106 [Actinomycetota bacterium]|nr:hypothetical protein [Actinomycetota bacterium]